MLPDIRVVIVAVVSTFLFTVSVGFYTSSRLLNEPRKARSDSLASLEDSPINRIALNWPEPVQQTSQLDLDFAVTLNGSRNPVRDITNESVETQAQLKPPAPPATAVDSAATNQAPPTGETAAKTDEPALQTAEPAPTEEPASIQAARDILAAPAAEIAPTTSGLELAMQGAEAIVAPAPPPAEGPATTALMVPAPKPETQTENITREQAAQTEKPDTRAETKAENQSDPEETGTITVQDDDIPMPQARPDGAAPTPKKSIVVTKRARKPIRMTQRRPRPRVTPAPVPATTFFFPFNLFALQPNQPNQLNQFNQSAPILQTR